MDSENEHITRGRVRRELSEKNNENRSKWKDSKYLSSYQPLVPEEPSSDDQGATLRTIFEEHSVSDQSDN